MATVEETIRKHTDEALTVSDKEIPPVLMNVLVACASCSTEFTPEDDMHATCPACEAFSIRCGCVLGESCPICDTVAAIIYGSNEELPS